MPEAPEDGGNQENEPRKRRRGVPAFFTFLLIVIGLVLMADLVGKSLGKQEEIGYSRFQRLLYTGEVTEIVIEGETRITGTFLSHESGSPERVAFVCNVPMGMAKTVCTELQAFVDWPPAKIGEDEFRQGLESGGRLSPVKAWLVPGEELSDERVFVDYYDSTPAPGGQIRAEIVSDLGSGRQSVDVVALDQALGKLDVKIERIPIANGKDTVKVKIENTFLVTLFWNLIPWLLIIGIFWFFIFRQMRSPGGAGGVLSFGRARPTLVPKERTGVTFDDVAGVEEAKAEVREIVEFLKDPARFSRVGARIPRGVMLVGQPGTGKTLLARAIAGEASVPFFSISGSDFVEMFVGVGASRVRDLFRQAREKTPCLIFLDEIDAVGRRRGSGLGGGHDEREQTLNAILVEMDGFESDEGVILLAATNRPDVLDPALLRPGRFDRQIVIDLPDVDGREAILVVHARNVRMHPSVELSRIARGTPGFSGAELASLVNEAALRATLFDRDFVLMEDLEEARDRVRFGREKSRKSMEEDDRRLTAYHEAGHAVVGSLCEGVEPLHKVTIIPRGMALGATMVLPKKDQYHQRRNQLLGIISFAYGGRIAEEVFFNEISSGAYDDIHKATEIARTMVTQYGMSEKLGAVNYAEKDEAVFLGNDIGKKRSYSDETAAVIDQEVRRILDGCYDKAHQLIEQNKKKVEEVADALLKFETLHGEEVEAILSGVSAEEARRRWEAKRSAAERESAMPPRPAESEPRGRTFPEPEGGLPPAGEPAVS